MVVVKIGGTNGSGKSSLIRAALAKYAHVPVMGAKKIEAYNVRTYLPQPVVVLGSYVNVCGGMDGISDKHERLALVRKYAAGENVVLYEGLITGKTYGAMGALSEEPGQRGNWIYAFMDTPYDVCVERIMQRRAAKGNHAPFDPERTVRATFNSCISTAKRAAEQGHRVLMLDHTMSPAEQLAVVFSEVRGLLRRNKNARR